MKTIHSATEVEAREKWHRAIEAVPIGASIIAYCYVDFRRMILTQNSELTHIPRQWSDK